MNTQKPSRRNTSDKLFVHSIFPTIQGEGPLVGTPSVFIRLSNCNLQCPLCDTDYTGGSVMTPEEARDALDAFPQKLVVVTGGEPFLQHATMRLLELLLDEGRKVQVETNGTTLPPGQSSRLYVCWQRGLMIVVSPKTSNVTSVFAELAAAYKYVARSGDLMEDGLPATALDNRIKRGILARPDAFHTVYLQPADEGDPTVNKANLDAVVASCMRHGYLLGVQVHKIIGVQ